MAKTRCDAWFCDKCHSYHEKKIFSANIPSGQIYKSWETCRKCANRQRVEVKTDYWGAERIPKEGESVCPYCKGSIDVPTRVNGFCSHDHNRKWFDEGRNKLNET